MPAPMKPLAERLFARVDADGPCWLWNGAITAAGYGLIGRGRRGDGVAYTHRTAWEVLVGPIPQGLDLDHLCRVRRCCNPDHLEPVTRTVNVARGAQRPGYAERTRTHCKNNHEFTPENTIRTAKQRVCEACQRDRSRRRRAAAS